MGSFGNVWAITLGGITVRRTNQEKTKIVDDDVDWHQMVKEEEVVEEDEDEAPVIAEVIDERPVEVKQLEAFRNSNRWKVIGADSDVGTPSSDRNPSDSPELSYKKSENESSPVRKTRHDSPDASPPRRARHDSPDASPPRRARHDSPDLSPPRQRSGKSGKVPSKDLSQKVKKRAKNSDSDQSPPRKKAQKGNASDSDQSPPRRRPKASRGSDSDQSPPRRRTHARKNSDDDLSPPRRPGHSQDPKMLSGGKAGLVSLVDLRKEQEENRRMEKKQPVEEESRHAQTVFRDKSGKKRNLDAEREEQRKKDEEKAAKDEKYAQWGKGLAQKDMYQQRLEDAVTEAQKPLARHRDDEDLDRMLREQERDGDPMAAMLRRKKEKNPKTKERPRYKGPAPPPNRFNIPPGYRWDGVNRSNGFEQKRYARIADKKAVQMAAYKWSVEDM